MTRKIQTKKNLELSEKLANYIVNNPEAVKSLPKNVSFIVFSSEDESLNKKNEGFIKSVLAEGKNVVKAIQTKNKSNPWKFSQVAY